MSDFVSDFLGRLRKTQTPAEKFAQAVVNSPPIQSQQIVELASGVFEISHLWRDATPLTFANVSGIYYARTGSSPHGRYIAKSANGDSFILNPGEFIKTPVSSFTLTRQFNAWEDNSATDAYLGEARFIVFNQLRDSLLNAFLSDEIRFWPVDLFGRFGKLGSTSGAPGTDKLWSDPIDIGWLPTVAPLDTDDALSLKSFFVGGFRKIRITVLKEGVGTFTSLKVRPWFYSYTRVISVTLADWLSFNEDISFPALPTANNGVPRTAILNVPTCIDGRMFLEPHTAGGTATSFKFIVQGIA